MKIRQWKHENVREDGVIIKDGKAQGGAVFTEPTTITQGLVSMACKGRDSSTSTVSGITIYFDSHEEMENWPTILDLLNDLKF